MDENLITVMYVAPLFGSVSAFVYVHSFPEYYQLVVEKRNHHKQISQNLVKITSTELWPKKSTETSTYFSINSSIHAPKSLPRQEGKLGVKQFGKNSTLSPLDDFPDSIIPVIPDNLDYHSLCFAFLYSVQKYSLR